jgi:hypothetical protein
MAVKTIAQKLLIKPNMTVLALNQPEDVSLEPLPDDAKIVHSASGPVEVVLLFSRSVADLNAYAEAALGAYRADSALWFCYPKKTGKIKTDINRDHGWDEVSAADFHAVTQISIDDTWSAVRFRPRSEIKVMTRKF